LLSEIVMSDKTRFSKIHLIRTGEKEGEWGYINNNNLAVLDACINRAVFINLGGANNSYDDAWDLFKNVGTFAAVRDDANGGVVNDTAGNINKVGDDLSASGFIIDATNPTVSNRPDDRFIQFPKNDEFQKVYFIKNNSDYTIRIKADKFDDEDDGDVKVLPHEFIFVHLKNNKFERISNNEKSEIKLHRLEMVDKGGTPSRIDIGKGNGYIQNTSGPGNKGVKAVFGTLTIKEDCSTKTLALTEDDSELTIGSANSVKLTINKTSKQLIISDNIKTGNGHFGGTVCICTSKTGNTEKLYVEGDAKITDKLTVDSGITGDLTGDVTGDVTAKEVIIDGIKLHKVSNSNDELKVDGPLECNSFNIAGKFAVHWGKKGDTAYKKVWTSLDTHLQKTWTQDLHVQGNLSVTGTYPKSDAAYYLEWSDGNPNGEDRLGQPIYFDGDKISIADKNTPTDQIKGVVSATATVILNAAEFHWKGKYQFDDWGRGLLNDDGTPKLNPKYDPKIKYIPRKDRPEWAVIGLLGTVYVAKNAPVNPRWIKLKSNKVNDLFFIG